ncbi:MAG: tRNA (adenosine(37)-N6)-threonylcarbamoyltransferase complex dimerization subunit type 1 TsaB [Elusimicrobia bacterium]|nr:tRNA (adenosine(37)-N6)-threonylcarbamoyltransferase complex dimerization subunit type 1 TsaB [Elusimicrobiota bacterium]
MNILAVDGTGETLTVALDAGGKIYSARRSGKKPHDETLLPLVESVLKRAKISWKNLDAVAAAAGPGRFTGIRIGLSFAAICGMQLEIPALALSRLEAAAGKSDADRVRAALPGWKNEVYHQAFRWKNGVLTADGDPEWTAPEAWPARRSAEAARGTAVVEGDVGAVDLLPVARRRLASKKFPPFEPFYLKPAGYEKPPR